jgi:hypothetical protein
MSKRIQIHIEWKTKKVTLIEPNNVLLQGDEAGIYIIDEGMLKAKAKEPIDMFEEDLLEILTVEQEIKLYKYWGNRLNRTVMIGRTANNIGIDKPLTKKIIGMAESYGLLVSGWNSTWRVPLDIVKERWIDKAKEKEGYLKDPDEVSRASMSPNEVLAHLQTMGTEEQKAVARGEGVGSRGNKRVLRENRGGSSETTVEVVPEQTEEFYSGAKEAKRLEREQWERENVNASKKAIEEMNKGAVVELPKGIKRIEKPVLKMERNAIVKTPEKIAQNLPTKKHVPSKSTRKG